VAAAVRTKAARRIPDLQAVTAVVARAPVMSQQVIQLTLRSQARPIAAVAAARRMIRA